MTEVQGQMSDLIARIAHPEEVLTRSNAQHASWSPPAGSDAAAAALRVRTHIRGTEHILAGLV